MYTNQPNTLRNEFLLDPKVIYFNHGSFGATPRPIFESYQYWQRELELQPTYFFGHRAPGLLTNARSVLAEFLGTADQNIAFVTNATVGINTVANSIRLQPGDEILSTNHEYGSLDRTWRFHAEKQGCKYINHPLPLPMTTPEELVAKFWEGVTERTRVIYISHITSPTALIFPVKEIIHKARERNIITVIDGAHAPGQIDIDLDDLGADFYTGNLHKWLCAPKSVGFLYVHPDRQDWIQPPIISWGFQSEHPSSNHLADYVEVQGTRDMSAFLTVPDVIKFFNNHHWEEVRENCHNLLVEIMTRIQKLTGLSPISPISHQWFSQMACAPIPFEINNTELRRRLLEDFRIEIPIVEWNSTKMARISVQGYNTLEDGFALVNALQVLLAE